MHNSKVETVQNPELEQTDQGQRGGEFIHLYLRHERKIHGYILCLVNHWSDADDILQQTAAIMWKKYQPFTSSQHFLNWALRIAHFEVMNYFHQNRNHLPCYSPELFASLESKVTRAVQEKDRRCEALEKCIAGLRQRDQELLHLRYEVDATISRVATTVGRSVDAVYKALNRIHHQLLHCIRHRLAQEEPL